MKGKQIITEANELLEFAKDIRRVALDPDKQSEGHMIGGKTINSCNGPFYFETSKFSSMLAFASIESIVDHNSSETMTIRVASMFDEPGTRKDEECDLIMDIDNSGKIPLRINKVKLGKERSFKPGIKYIQTNSKEEVEILTYFKKVKLYNLFLRLRTEHTYRVIDDKLKIIAPSFDLKILRESEIRDEALELCWKLKRSLKSYLPSMSKRF